MVRISDARMSGTAFGTIILHASPEAAVGGPLALIRNGDMITLNAPERTLSLDVPEDELERRRSELAPAAGTAGMRGYLRMFHDHVTQAGSGCDFDFLTSGKADKKTP
jgi:dihydroxyacid dehydratase/phosphogluconate dehydratase